MPRKKMLGIAGSALMALGVFTPIVTLPLVGSQNYFQNGKGDGVILLVLAAISLALVLKDKYKWLWYPALGSLAFMLYGFISALNMISDFRDEMAQDAGGGALSGLAQAAAQAAQVQWGWVILFAGAGLLIAAAAVKEEGETAPSQAKGDAES
ncbi:MAG: hypothetical protein D6740_11125 [Alphaproteobacteria bacterium]|nr:MAG: hypothetical protein D6740_11125 [Alphaproteobacteria bacterium]